MMRAKPSRSTLNTSDARYRIAERKLANFVRKKDIVDKAQVQLDEAEIGLAHAVHNLGEVMNEAGIETLLGMPIAQVRRLKKISRAQPGTK